MQGLSPVKEYSPSMVGVGLVADILSDLPLPSPIPTPLESLVTGNGQMKPEALHVLNNCDPNLCAQIAKSLKCADTSFLKLKVAPPNQDYRPDVTSPVLIKTLLKNGFPHPRLKLKKLDSSQFGGPHSSPSNSSITSSPFHNTVPSFILSPHQLPSSDVTPSLYSPLSAAITDHPQTDSKKKMKKTRLPSSEKRRKGSLSRKSKSNQMIVSIDKRLLGDTVKDTQTKPYRKGSSSRRQLLSSDNSDEEFKLPVSISRHKLSKSTRKPSHPSSPWTTDSLSYASENITPNQRVGEEFTLAPGIQDRRVPDEQMKKKKKKKKKHRQDYQMDNIHRARIERYNLALEAILEQVDQEDSLLSRQYISQLLSETAQLKQLRVLHQASTELLVKIIGTMDSHVLDTASLLMNEPTDEVDIKYWREMARERILRSLDAGLVTLHITTTPNMPKHVHLEESIDLLISHTKYHLENNIYPEYDPVYRAEAKESGINAKQKRRNTSTASKDVVPMYNRLVEVMDILALLVDKQSLTDVTILKLSSLGVMPFFVENINNLQLSSLKLVRAIFSRYEKHRDLIFEEVFASLARLPTTKKNLRSFRLSNGQSVQMLTALILQLLQCTVIPFFEQESHDANNVDFSDTKKSKVSLDVAVVNSYELALRTGSNFITTFMNKCCSSKDEDDFRSLFDNFVQDLLSTLGLPEWPASEVLLTLLGVLLSQTFSDRNKEQQLRLTSLEHLGVIAARLRKDAISSVDESHQQIIDILAEITQTKLDGISPLPSPTDIQKMDAFSENSMNLQKALIAFLSQHSAADPSYTFARNFYIAQWLRDCQIELQKGLQRCSSPTHDIPTLLHISDDEDSKGHTVPQSLQIVQQAETTKEFLTALGKPMSSTAMSSLASILDDNRAVIVNKYLLSNKPLNKGFDMYLQQILKVLIDSASAVLVRTKAMKTLSTIVAADPTILSRIEVQKAVCYKLTDSSTLMREAAIDLIGRFVLIQPDLTSNYYQMLLDRIKDTGVSVRRRVIKIFKDICVNQPDFDKITEICIYMIRRMNDEEGIKQLVTAVFHQLWFTKPVQDSQQQIKQRVLQITEVISTSKVEKECFELLLAEILKDASSLSVCQSMVDCLVEQLLYLDESSDQQKSSSKLLTRCMLTLFLFTQSKPSFMVHHCKTLHPYLSTKCTSHEDSLLIHHVARIFEKVVPLMDRPSQSFLSSLEEDLVKLIMAQAPIVVQSCIGCLAQVVIKVTNNFSLVSECYLKFYSFLEKYQSLYNEDPNQPKLTSLKPSMLRSTYTVGLFYKHFDIDKILPTPKSKQQLMSNRVYSLLLTVCGNYSDEDIKLKSLTGFGLLCINHPELMLEKQAKDIYISWLAKDAPLRLKLQVMKNIMTYLCEVESTLKQADASRKNEESEENLMELGDRHSSVSSNIAQLYLPQILDTYYTTEARIRMTAVESVLLILSQGLVHPGQCVPHLIAMSTDSEEDIKEKADVQLSDYSSRFGGFMQTHLVTGVKKAYQFQQLIAELVVRGCTDPARGGGIPASLLSHIYTLVRSSKPQRRAFLKAVLKPFEDFDKTPLGMLLFLADNLSSFPYSVIEEPLFVIHHIDMTISITGTSVLQSFKEALGQSGMATVDDDEEDAVKLSQESDAVNLNLLNECCVLGLGCVLLLILKQYVKQSYSLSDKKCQEYSPSNSNKMWDSKVTRRQGNYNPREVIDEVQRMSLGKKKTRSKEDCIRLYIHFKRLMNRLDPFEGDDDDDGGGGGGGGGGVFENTIQQQDGGDSLIMNPKSNKSITGTASSVTPKSRKRSQSRTSSRASSISSTTSVRSKGKGKKRKKKRKRRDTSSSDEDSNGGFETGSIRKPTSKKKRYVISDSDSEM